MGAPADGLGIADQTDLTVEDTVAVAVGAIVPAFVRAEVAVSAAVGWLAVHGGAEAHARSAAAVLNATSAAATVAVHIANGKASRYERLGREIRRRRQPERARSVIEHYFTLANRSTVGAPDSCTPSTISAEVNTVAVFDAPARSIDSLHIAAKWRFASTALVTLVTCIRAAAGIQRRDAKRCHQPDYGQRSSHTSPMQEVGTH